MQYTTNRQCIDFNTLVTTMLAMMRNQNSNANNMGDVQHSGDVLVDNLVDKMFDVLEEFSFSHIRSQWSEQTNMYL